MLLQAEVSKSESVRSSEPECDQVISNNNSDKKDVVSNSKLIDTNNDRVRQRSLNSMWCGCLATGTEYTASTERPTTNVHTQHLPSSAIQSMESLSTSRKSNPHCRDPVDGRSSFDYTICAQPAINLPSCALITDALLSRSKLTESKMFESNKSNRSSKYRSAWSVLKMYRKRNKSDKNKKPMIDAKEIASLSVQDGDTDALRLEPEVKEELDEALVFSPLPTQLVPEASQPEKRRAFNPNPYLINKVDINLLYSPRFDSLFRRHQTTLLGPRSENDKTKKCFVIDLDETLVHSSFKVVEHADFKVGVEIDGVTHRVYVLKRPYVDLFLSTMANLYECVLFTASLAKYADPVADFIDKWNAFRYRLFRESCVYHRGNYVKDLSHLGRPINQIVILDNSPASYMFHANHAVQISSWFDDANDRVLLDLIPYFERLAAYPNVVDFLRNNSPPTPYAAIGTVGLPPGLFPHMPYPAASGRASDGNAVISNVRRPTVVSPLPALVPENRSHVYRNSASTPNPSVPQATPTPDPNKPKPNSPKPGIRVSGPGTLPVITKLASPSSGPTLTPTPQDHENVTFPAPLSIASYVPVSGPTPSLTTSTRPTSGSSAQTRVTSPGQNSHNSPNANPTDSVVSGNTAALPTQPIAAPTDINAHLPSEVPTSSPSVPPKPNLTASPNLTTSTNQSRLNAMHNSRTVTQPNRPRPGFHNPTSQNHKTTTASTTSKTLSPGKPRLGPVPASTSPSLSLNRQIRH